MVSPELLARYCYWRSRDWAFKAGAPITAVEAIAEARADALHNRPSYGDRHNYLNHGSVIRSRGKDGARRTFVVAHIPDDDMGAPWDEHDGHGEVRELRHRDEKRPGEVIIGESGGWAYDFAGACKTARTEWGLNAEDMAALERKAGRMIGAEAARKDMERMDGWLRDRWNWIGIALIELPRDEELSPSSVADEWAASHRHHMPGRMAASLWGIESDAGSAFLDEVARDLLSEA